MGGYRLQSGVLSRLGNSLPTHFHPLSPLSTSPFSLRHGQHEGKRHPRFFCPFFNFTAEQHLQSRSFLPLILSTTWPADLAMAHQIPLATLSPSSRESTLRNKARTVDLPLQTRARFL